jgi:hypothetical protein
VEAGITHAIGVPRAHVEVPGGRRCGASRTRWLQVERDRSPEGQQAA